MVADELELVRFGVAAALAPLGIGVVAECRSARDVVEEAAFALPDLVVVGRVSDATTLETLRRLQALDPTPRLVGLFAHAGDADAGAAAASGVHGVALRSSSVASLVELVEHVLKDEIVVAPELAGALVGEVRGESTTEREPTGLLSGREQEMLRFLADGRTNREIADALSISLATVKTHLVRLYAKLEVGNRNEALRKAVTLRLLA